LGWKGLERKKERGQGKEEEERERERKEKAPQQYLQKGICRFVEELREQYRRIKRNGLALFPICSKFSFLNRKRRRVQLRKDLFFCFS